MSEVAPHSERYQRQLLLPHFGEEKQQRLLQARVLVVGAGGLGCPVLLYLAAAGVGHISIVDFDTVALSNLHRQVLYSAEDIGQQKAIVAARKIAAAYPDSQLMAHNIQLDARNALALVAAHDLVIDGSDNFPTRYLVNDACVLLGKPLVYGSVYRFEGQVAVFNHTSSGAAENRSTNYRDLFPMPPAPHEVPNCADAGVIGVLPGIIGSMQANEAIKLITGMGEPLVNRLLTYNALNSSFYEVALSPNPEAAAHAPTSKEDFEARQHQEMCSTGYGGGTELLPEQFAQLARLSMSLLVDVRQEEEQPKLQEYPFLPLPLQQLEERLPELEQAEVLLLFCQSGVRSQRAVERLQACYPTKEIYSLKGGIAAWNSYHKQATHTT